MRKRVCKRENSSLKGMHREDIKAAIRKRGWTFVQLDRCFGLTRGSAQCALWHPHFHGELAIAEILKLSPRQIWPERFKQNGERKHQIRNRQSSVSEVNRQSSTQEVA